MIKFSLRRYISVGLALSFLMIIITGTVLYIAPPGRVSRWIDWVLLGLTRSQWETQHTLFSYLFIIFGVIHLFLINWKTFLSYLRFKINRKSKRMKEVFLAFATTLLVFSLAFFEVPPVISVMNLGNKLSETWEIKIGTPPVPGIEDMTLSEIAERFFESNTEMVIDQVRNAGYDTDGPEQSLSDIAAANSVSPMEIFSSISLQTSPV